MEPVLSPGVYVERGTESRPPLEGAHTGGCAFLGRTRRGEPRVPRRVESWGEFVERYGDEGITARAVRGFFRNGGEHAWIVSLGSLDRPIHPSEFADDGGTGALTGLERIEEPELVATPELASLAAVENGRADVADIVAAQLAIVARCERSATRMALLDAPFAGDPLIDDSNRILDWRRHFGSSYAVLLAPWILTREGTAPVPPSGHVAGTWARCARDEGVHRAPANVVLEDAVGTSPALDRGHRTELQLDRICTLHHSPLRGVRVFGAWTASADPADRAPVRRLLIHLRRSIESWADWAAFEPNDPALWKVLTRSIDGFLADLWRRGALAGERREQAWFVRCDEEANPPEARDAGRLCIDVGVAPVRPAEFLVVRIHQRTQIGRLTRAHAPAV